MFTKTYPDMNPSPVTVTVWPSTRSVSGVAVSVGRTISVAGSNVRGTTACFSGDCR